MLRIFNKRLRRAQGRAQPQISDNNALGHLPFDTLRKKWGTVPAAGALRLKTQELLILSDQDLLNLWHDMRKNDTTGERFQVRGWYHSLYKDIVKGKDVLDVGSGLGIDGITFAQAGARVTFVDIVKSNIELLSRICKLLHVTNVDFCYMENVDSLVHLGTFDIIWCQGSLINAPFDIIRAEIQELLRHLPIGGRWIELAYPRVRWERDGSLPFERWGEITDGTGTPWMEWYDLEKLQAAFDPATFNVVLYFDFCDYAFNWFDLIRLT